MRLQLPPLNPLKVFAVVAKTLNFTAAAEELHISQSAVTRQISVLQDYVGFELYRRSGRGIVLTLAGKTYADRIRPALEEISLATDQLMRRTANGALVVMTYNTLSAKWLIPRLADFMLKNPDIDVQIVSSHREVDFAVDQVDLAIQYGQGPWPGADSELLLRDCMEPVCSPAYLQRMLDGGAEGPEKLLQGRLLDSEHRSRDWSDWLAGTGHEAWAAHAEHMSFSTYQLVWQAAIDGLGTAIGYIPQLEDDIAAGRLVAPFQQALRRDQGYYLVWPRRRSQHPHVQGFRAWLLAASQRFR